MSNIKFNNLAENRFSFLVSDYAFKLQNTRKKALEYQLLYLNDFTGVEITYEYREGYIFVMLFKLIKGKLIKDPLIIKENSVLYCYGLDDIILLRNPADLIKPSYNYSLDSKYHDKECGLDKYISDFADNLKRYADDVLRGDFSIFEKLDKIVKERQRNSY